MRVKSLIGLIVVCSILSSCMQKYDFDKVKNIEYNGDWALPIASGNFSIEDIIQSDNSTFFDYDSNGSIWLTFHKNLESYSLEELVPNNTINFDYYRFLTSHESNNLSQYGSTSFNFIQNIVLDNENINRETIAMDSAFILQGTFYFRVKNVTQHNLELDLLIPSISKNGLPFSKSFVIPPSSSEVYSFDVKDYKMVFQNGVNDFDLEFSANITRVSSANTVGGIEIDFGMRDDFKFESIYGDVDRQKVMVANNENLKLSLFDFDEIGSNIVMNDAQLRFKWSNSHGVPVDFYFTSVMGTNKKNETYSLDMSNLPYPSRVLEAPTVKGQELKGDIVFTDKDTKTGSGRLSLNEFINKNVNEMEITGYALSNPPSITLPSYKNYLYHFGQFNLDFEVAIQLAGYVTDFGFRDTLEFDLGEDIEVLQSASLRINATNGFPIDLSARFVFMDANYNTLFTLDDAANLLLKSAEVDAGGNSIIPSNSITEYNLDAQAISSLPMVKYVNVMADFSTTDNGAKPIKLSNKDRLAIKIGARVVVKENLSI